jgi:hypothetical protein
MRLKRKLMIMAWERLVHKVGVNSLGHKYKYHKENKLHQIQILVRRLVQQKI